MLGDADMAFEMTRLPHSFQLHPAHILTAGSFWVSLGTGAVALDPKTNKEGTTQSEGFN